MANNQIQFSENEEKRITIWVKKSNLFARIMLLLFLIMNFIAPLLSLYFMANEGVRLKLGTFLSFALFWGIAYYFFRLYSWNSYGKEIISFGDKINYHSDYKFFKDSQTEINGNNITFQYEEIGYKENNEGVLIIKNDEETIRSVVKVKIPELQEAINELETYIE